MQLVNRLTIAIVGFSVLACADRVAEVRPLIDQAIADLEAAYLQGDAGAVAALMTEDVVVMPNDMEDIRGREAVQGFLSLFFRANTVVAYKLVVQELELVGNTAYERGIYTWTSIGAAQDTSLERGRYSIVRKRGADGAWRIHRLLENTSPRLTHPFLER